MVTPAASQVVIVPFPFSDLSQAKLRPAVVLANAGRGDWILCQVTSRPYGDPHAIRIEDRSLRGGVLQMTSYIRPSKLFTGSVDLMVGTIGTLDSEFFTQVVVAVVRIISSEARKT